MFRSGVYRLHHMCSTGSCSTPIRLCLSYSQYSALRINGEGQERKRRPTLVGQHVDLIILWVEPGDVALLEIGRRSNLLGVMKRCKVVCLDFALEYFNDSVRIAVVVNGGPEK